MSRHRSCYERYRDTSMHSAYYDGCILLVLCFLAGDPFLSMLHFVLVRLIT